MTEPHPPSWSSPAGPHPAPVWSPTGAPVPPAGALPVYQPGGGPEPDTNLLKDRILQYLVDWLISLALALPGLVVVIVGIARGSVAWLVAGLVVWQLLSFAAIFWVEVLRAHRHGGQTYGMSALDLRVVDAATLGPPTLGQLAIRWILFLLVDSGLVAVILIAVTERHQRLGDMAAKTLVVRVDDPVVAAARAAQGLPA